MIRDKDLFIYEEITVEDVQNIKTLLVENFQITDISTVNSIFMPGALIAFINLLNEDTSSIVNLMLLEVTTFDNNWHPLETLIEKNSNLVKLEVCGRNEQEQQRIDAAYSSFS